MSDDQTVQLAPQLMTPQGSFRLKTGSTRGSSLRQNLISPVELSGLSALNFSRASSLRPLSSKLHEEETCQFAKKPPSPQSVPRRATEIHPSEEPRKKAPLCP